MTWVADWLLRAWAGLSILTRRGFHFAWVLVRHGLALFLALLRRMPLVGRPLGWLSRPLARRLPDADRPGPVRFRALLEDLGGTFVKLGQMLALQPDMVPRAYCNALFDLLDRVEPFPWPEVERIVREDLGRTPDEIFDRVDQRPLATASVGQVHVAWLGGQKVALKVQRPNADREFGSDIRIFGAILWAIQTFRLRSLDWVHELGTEFIAWTREELDFRCEARYAERLERCARDRATQKVPRVWSELVTRRVLVIEFLEGATLLAYLRAREEGDTAKVRALEPPGFDAERFAANIIDNFLHDAFENGVYHADLHPANLMILPNSVVGYIDFGISGVVSRHSRRHLVSMTLALSVGDLDLLLDRFLGVLIHDPDADALAFRRGLEEAFEVWYEEVDGVRRLDVNFTRIMADLLTVSRRTRMLPVRDILKYIRSTIAVDGLITRFAPDFEVGEYLASSCYDYIVWKSRSEAVAPERVLDWAAAGAKLLRHGPRRASRALDRWIEDDERLDLDDSAAARGGGRPLALAGAALAVALAAGLSPAPDTLSTWPRLDLWTAQVLFVLGAASAAALTALLGAVRSSPSARAQQPIRHRL